MTNFEWCKYAYDKGWADAEDLKIWVQAGKITESEYEEITGIPYAV